MTAQKKKRVDPAQVRLTARLALSTRITRLLDTCDDIVTEARRLYRAGHLTEAEYREVDNGCDTTWHRIVDCRPKVPLTACAC